MRTRILSIITIVAIPLFSMGCSKQVSFKDDIKPILTSNCVMCHDGSNGVGFVKSGFSVQSYNSFMKGTKFGPVIVAGDSISSTLYRLIDHMADPKIQMPPHHDTTLAEQKLKPLTSAQIETIKTWIDQGAKNN